MPSSDHFITHGVYIRSVVSKLGWRHIKRDHLQSNHTTCDSSDDAGPVLKLHVTDVLEIASFIKPVAALGAGQEHRRF